MKIEENPSYLNDQLITYLGNKRALLDLIQRGVRHVLNKLGQQKLRTLDLFSGSGIVSRFLKSHSSYIIANDLEDYAHIINTCYLSNREKTHWEALEEYYTQIAQQLAAYPLQAGFITDLYAPQNDVAIGPDERVFYTRRNAMFLDTARTYIAQIPQEFQPLLLAPLLSQASIHANTAGVFKGFYKNNAGVGQFGGQGRHALSRITGKISLNLPVLSNYHCDYDVYQQDANQLVSQLEEVDMAYLDPPYNQHPYGSNYFMLNLLTTYERPAEISCVSGIPKDWNRSMYNKKPQALSAMQNLCEKIRAKFLLISFSSEGFISKEEMTDMLGKLGELSILEEKYPTFRGSRNLKERALSVHEYLYVLEKK